MLTVTSPHPTDRHLSPSCRPSHLPILLTITSPPLKGAGGMLIAKPSPLPILLTVTFSHPIDHHFSPFEGGWGDVKFTNRHIFPVLLTIPSPPLKGAGGMLSLQTVTSLHPADRHISPFEGSPRAGAAEYVQRGDVNRQIVKSSNRQIC